jgi:hypothetical protein
MGDAPQKDAMPVHLELEAYDTNEDGAVSFVKELAVNHILSELERCLCRNVHSNYP